MDIRRLEPDDVELLDAGVRVLTGRSSPAPEMFLRDPRAHAFVAIDDDASSVVGCAYGYEFFRPDGFWVIVLCDLGVAEPYRQQGVGRELLETFVTFARGKGHTKMWLFTDAGNAAARRLYDGAGGERDEATAGYWWVFE